MASSSCLVLVLVLVVTLLGQGIDLAVLAIVIGLVEACSRESRQFRRLVRAVFFLVLCYNIVWDALFLFLYTQTLAVLCSAQNIAPSCLQHKVDPPLKRPQQPFHLRKVRFHL